ncbi:hypothetical protein [Phaffia rhodozyma]|uniref:Protein CPL1-like domain-containing protein n=1 Tax=Phaffia rhodozyma TaxID=264483 RepID=A0A0F7SY32_PHARH|nr:hypothetical protein [Phaffia rhodozyma]
MKIAIPIVALTSLLASVAHGLRPTPNDLPALMERNTVAVAAELDICVVTKVDIAAQLTALLDLDQILLTLLGISLHVDIDICLCVSLVADFVASDATAQKFVNLLTQKKGLSQLAATQKVIDGYTTMIKNQTKRQTCPILTRGTRVCNAKGSQICGVKCPAGSTLNASTGVCSTPAPSARALSPDRRAFLRQRELCNQPGFELCPVGGLLPKGKTPVNGWECVNTFKGLETCGGCPASDELLASISLGVSVAPVSLGVDCSVLEGVSTVSCSAGVCAVEACVSDSWILSDDHTSCIAH